MKTPIAKNPQRIPQSVITYSETTQNPLDWYGLTETSNSILNELIAFTGREELKESLKSVPDPGHLQEIEVLFQEVHAINKNPENFKSLSLMREIINQYAPILRAIYGAV